MVNTRPIIKAVMLTNGKDLLPIMKHCFRNSLNSYGGKKASLKKRRVKRVKEVIPAKNPFIPSIIVSATDCLIYSSFVLWVVAASFISSLFIHYLFLKGCHIN
jgi:hypothetical protein